MTTKTVLITGASTGIGVALAEAYAAKGCNLILMARRRELLDALKQRLEAAYPGIQIVVAPTDVAQPEKHMDDIRAACAQFPALHIAIANAGVGGTTNEWENISAKSFEILRVNVLGAVATLEACKEIMLKQGFGRLVGITSVASVRGLPQSSAYCASKAALEKYLESMRVDLAYYGIDVTAIHPGFIATPMTAKNGKMPFLLTPEVAAQKIVHAIDRRKARLIFPWPMAVMVRVLRYLPNTVFDALMKISRGRARVFRKDHEKNSQIKP